MKVLVRSGLPTSAGRTISNTYSKVLVENFEPQFFKKTLKNSLPKSESILAMSQAAKKISQFEKVIQDKKAHPTDAPNYWFIARGSVLKGPFTIEELYKKIETKDVSIFDYAWRQGFSEWRSLGSISEIQKDSNALPFEAYPSIPVPGKQQEAHTSSLTEEAAPLPTSKKRKDIEVRLRASSKAWFSVRQSFFMVIFSLAVSYTTLSWFQSKLQHNFQNFFQTKSAGMILKVGSNPESASSHIVWNPLFSAPSYTDLKDRLELPVTEFGFLSKASDKWHLGELDLEKAQGEKLDGLDLSELDPIYIRPVQVEGHLSPENPKVLRLKQIGEPYLTPQWNRPF